jgi:Cu/Ag efflux protein CusF
MRKALVPLFASAMVAISSPSWAWAQVTGSINSVDPEAREITLDNGTVYTLQRSVNLDNLSAGDKITVNTETTKAGKHLVNKVIKTG